MKVRFEKKDLVRALDTAQIAAQKKISSNTNNGIYIYAKDGKAEFQANDYTIAIKTTVPCEVEEEGIVNIISPQLIPTIHLLPDAEVVMEQKPGENNVSFKSGTYISVFPTRDYNDFPELRSIDHAQHCVLKCSDLRMMDSLISFASDKAASMGTHTALFTGVLYEVHGSVFSMAATNTHQLACRDLTMEKPATADGRFIVPAGITGSVCHLFPEGEDEEVEISWAKSHVAYTFGSTYFVSSLINGDYPDYRRIIPTHFDADVELSIKDITDAVRFVSPMSRETNYQTINFHFQENQVEIYEEDPETGRSDTTIPCKLTGSPIQITFNVTYISDILKHSKGDVITFHLLKNGPMLVEQEEDKAYQYVVTPMRGRD